MLSIRWRVADAQMTHFTVAATSPRVQHTTASGVLTYAFPFAVMDAEDISVYLGADLVDAGEYSVSGLRQSTGGAVTFDNPVEPGKTITIVRIRPIKRMTDFLDGGEFRADTVNDALDSLTMIAQQLKEAGDRAIHVGIASPVEFDATLPSPLPARRAVMTDAEGDGITYSTYDPDSTVGIALDAQETAQEAVDVANTALAAANAAGATSQRAWGPFELIHGVQVYGPLSIAPPTAEAVEMFVDGLSQPYRPIGGQAAWAITNEHGPGLSITLTTPVRDNPGPGELQAGLPIYGTVLGGITEAAIGNKSIQSRHFADGAIDFSGAMIKAGPANMWLRTDSAGHVAYEPIPTAAAGANVGVDCTKYGFSPSNSAAGNTAAVMAAVASLPYGGTVLLPSGVYAVEGITITSINRLTIKGNGTVLAPSNDGDDITFIGCQYSKVTDIDFQPSIRKTYGFAIRLAYNCFRCEANNIKGFYGWNGIDVFGSTESRVSNVSFRQMFGANVGIRFSGDSEFRSYRLIVNDINNDNPYPLEWGTRVLWHTSTTYNAGDILINAGNIYQCSVAGTSAASGAGPSGIPGISPSSAFYTEIADGSCRWKFVANMFSTLITYDSYAYSLVINRAAALNCGSALFMTDSANTGSSYPMWCWVYDLEADHNLLNGVVLDRGEGAYIEGSWIGSCLSGSGVVVGGNFRGEIDIGKTCRIMGNWQYGISISAGPVNTKISGANILQNSAANPGQYHGIAVGDGLQKFSITNNHIGAHIGLPAWHGYGIFLGASTDHCNISGNVGVGNILGICNEGPVSTSTKIVFLNTE